MASFSCFPELPKELQEMVWDHAAQSAGPGVQIFEFQAPESKQYSQTSSTTTSVARPPKQKLAFPLPSKYFPAVDGSIGNSNVSSYMASIGLWTACKESWYIMEKNTERSKQNLEKVAKKEYRFFEDTEHLPAMGHFFCSTSQRFMVRPNRDLFVLQPSKIENINWSQVTRDIRKQLSPDGFQYPINIGIEFDREWGIKLEKGTLTEDFSVMCDAFREIEAQLWIIDHNLKRKEHIPEGS